MAEGKDQTGASWEDLPLPDEYPEPHTEEKVVLKAEAEEDVSAPAAEKSAKDQPTKGSPNLLQMLKAAESRWTPQGQDRNREESETGELVAEARKTDMVSEDADQDILYNMCACKWAPHKACTCIHSDC